MTMAHLGKDPRSILVDGGFVRLDGCMADDLSVVNSARVSFAQYETEMHTRNIGLLNFLMRERHGTPFEHNSFRFHVKAPIFVAREWFRHRIGSFNEWSGRYSQLDGDFHLPETDDMRTQVGKPGSYSFEPLPQEQAFQERLLMDSIYQEAYGTYLGMIERGVAKEVARMVLPVGIFTQFYWTVNARSVMNFISLRNADTAQREMQRYADAVEVLFSQEMPITHDAFLANDRTAP